MATLNMKSVIAKSVPASAAPSIDAKPATTPLVAKAATKPAAPVALAKVAPKAMAKPVAKKSVSVAKPLAKPPAKPRAKALHKPKAEKPVKLKKPKLVRDSFTIPKPEYTVLDELKQRAGKLASPVKKSELIRAGVKALAAMSDMAFVAALKAVPAIKTGRPAKAKTD